jgi:hypothetical protein
MGKWIAAQVENTAVLAYAEKMARDDVVAKLKATEPVLRGRCRGTVSIWLACARRGGP